MREGAASSARGVWIVVGLTLTWIYVSGIASIPLKREEPRQCFVAMEMIHSGNYVAPEALGDGFAKPPLSSWLVVLLSRNDTRHVGAWTLRLISLLALGGTAVVLWRMGFAASGGPAALPALVFLTTGAVVPFGRSGGVEPLLTFFILGGLASFELGRRTRSPWVQWFVSQLFLAAAMLTNLIAPLFFYPPLLYLVWRRRDRMRVPAGPPLFGFLAAIGLVAVWLVPYSMQRPWIELARGWAEFWTTRVLDAGWLGAVEQVLLAPLMLLAWMLPWSVCLLGGPTLWRAGLDRVREDPWLGLCSAVAVWGAFLFFFVPGHDSRYLVPLVPFVAVLVAAVTRHAVAALDPGGLISGLTRSAWFWSALALVWAAAIVGLGLPVSSPVGILVPLVLGLVALTSFALAGLRRDFLPPVPLALVLVGLFYGIAFAGFGEERRAGEERFASAVREISAAIQEDLPIVCHQDVDPDFGLTLSRLVGRPMSPQADGTGATYWIAGPGARPPALGEPVARTPIYNLWRVEEPETWSLLGEPLFPPPLDPSVRADRIRELAEARSAYERNPDSADAIIWLGRRTAYLGHYRKALSIYSAGLSRHPDDPRLYRHRGHRQITLRRFDRAVRDLERAAGLIRGRADQVEPDGLPNALNVPTSTLHSNIWYHLGLAYYLSGDLEQAARCYRECLKVSTNPDMLSATSHWLYTTLRREGREEEARSVLEPIRADMEIIENVEYHRLLLMYKGLLAADELLAEALAAGGVPLATTGYGIARWHLANGREDRALPILRRIVAGDDWAAFGHIAAESDLRSAATRKH